MKRNNISATAILLTGIVKVFPEKYKEFKEGITL